MNVDRAAFFLGVDTLAREARALTQHVRLRPMDTDFLEAERDIEAVRQFRVRFGQIAEALETWGTDAQAIIDAHMADTKP